jgi:hemoglobin
MRQTDFSNKGTTMNNRQYGVLFALMLGTTALAEPVFAQPATQAEQNLYHRLGGYDAIAAVTDEFIARLAGDMKFARFFGGLSTDSKLHLRQLVVDQLCAATGGPCVYIGRSMKQAHAGLGITEADWTVSAQHLGEALDKFHVGRREQDEVFAAVTKLKPDIVEAK